MIVVAKGRGLLIAAVAAGCMILTDFLTAGHYHDSDYYAHNGWPKLAAFFAAACIVWWMTLKRGDEVLTATHQATPKRSILRDQDSLFWIPARYWPGVLFVLGIALCFFRG
jgi:hypothetical protein